MFNEDHEIYDQYRFTTVEFTNGERTVEIDIEATNKPHQIRLYINGQHIATKSALTERAARQIAARLLR